MVLGCCFELIISRRLILHPAKDVCNSDHLGWALLKLVCYAHVLESQPVYSVLIVYVLHEECERVLVGIFDWREGWLKNLCCCIAVYDCKLVSIIVEANIRLATLLSINERVLGALLGVYLRSTNYLGRLLLSKGPLLAKWCCCLLCTVCTSISTKGILIRGHLTSSCPCGIIPHLKYF